MARMAEAERTTRETSITAKLNLDGSGEAKLDYPVGFMAHMLSAFAQHGLFDLEIRARGDLEVDQHHLVEDTGLVLGQCFAKALGERRGIRRVGSCFFPISPLWFGLFCFGTFNFFKSLSELFHTLP